MRLQLVIPVLTAFASLGAWDNSMREAPSEQVMAYQQEHDIARTRVDRARGRTWRLTLEGVVLQSAGEPHPVLLELPGWLVLGPADACAPDLAIGPKGEVVVTSNAIQTLWRIDPETLAVSEHPLRLDADNDRDVGFTGLAFSPAHGAYFATSHAQGTIWKVDTSLTRGEQVRAVGPSTQASERSLSCAIS